MRLYCELDESFEYIQVQLPWSLSQMRALIEEYIKEGKIRETEKGNWH